MTQFKDRSSIGADPATAASLFRGASLPPGAPASASREKIVIAHSTWVGYGALHSPPRKKKGFFKENGVDVDLPW